jgi:predicted CoA-substrate-specific enzyme activase
MVTVGLDVGSTTVKGVALDGSGTIRWKKYERHKTRQTEKVYQFLSLLAGEFGLPFRLFTTGSGGSRIAGQVNAKYFQEVNALSHSVERLHPEVRTVFELGGQDAKFILWRNGQGKFSTMNDRCAGGTGATIDRIIMKLNLTEDAVAGMRYAPQKVYHVAGKCGVFAETDINSLQKQGIPEDALMVSLFRAIVEQNLSVLVRGFAPEPEVLLLGGPNVFFPALRQAWSESIRELWSHRNGGTSMPADPGAAFKTPENALYYGAYGAALLGMLEEEGLYRMDSLPDAFGCGKIQTVHRNNGACFFNGTEERNRFFERYGGSAVGTTAPADVHGSAGSQIDSAADGTASGRTSGFAKGLKGSLQEPKEPLPVYIGIDGGSTSTKGVVLGSEEEVLWSAYKLSEGNPLTDARDILLALKDKADREMAVQGVGFTGYAKDLLREAFSGDIAVVETVAHTLGSLKYFPDADVICDVGGQDIKVIILKNGTVKDFRLNTQCSAGNGYYLQATAERFGFRVDQYADHAFQAGCAPEFNFGCAVFMESDIVNFQQLGWQAHEIMAGLARVLPLNIWLYVVQEPNLARLGKVFVLQGGTHNNLAVVKAQVDFIESRVKDARVHVHPYKEVAGAIGAALEAKRKMSGSSRQRTSSFIGFEDLREIHHQSRRDEETRCSFCKNRCLRTFITISAGRSKRQYIVSSCEKGQAKNPTELRRILHDERERRGRSVNFVDIVNDRFFGSDTLRRADGMDRKPEQSSEKNADPHIGRMSRRRLSSRRTASLIDAVVGIPRVLNMYSTAPFFRGYFEALGVGQLVFSDFSSREHYSMSSGRGSIDPCYPSKIAISHIHDLLYIKRVTHIFFPCLRMLSRQIRTDMNPWSCPVVAATPEVVKAAFTVDKDEFAAKGVVYMDPVLDLGETDVLERQMYASVRKQFRISRQENRKALLFAWDQMQSAHRAVQARAEQTLEGLVKNGEIGIVFLGRPYHNDPGINHGILEQLNRCGYHIYTIDSLPKSGFLTRRLFERDIAEGLIEHPLEIDDVWSRCYSENSSLKVWAAKFTARHPNLIALDLSSFRCGHDAMIYSVIDDIFNQQNLPYFTFHEIDENKPLGSIRLRVETIDYFLRRLREEQKRCREKSSLVV